MEARKIKYSALILTYIVMFVLHILMINMVLSGDFRDNEYSKRLLLCIGAVSYFAIFQRVIIQWDVIRVIGELLQYIVYVYGNQFMYIGGLVLLHLIIVHISKKKKTNDILYMLYILHIIQIFFLKMLIEKSITQLKTKSPIEKFSEKFIENKIDLIDTHDSVTELSGKLANNDTRIDLMLDMFMDNAKNITNMNKSDMSRSTIEKLFDAINK